MDQGGAPPCGSYVVLSLWVREEHHPVSLNSLWVREDLSGHRDIMGTEAPTLQVAVELLDMHTSLSREIDPYGPTNPFSQRVERDSEATDPTCDLSLGWQSQHLI